MAGSSKSTPPKSKPITIWLIVAAVAALAIGVALYMVWRRAGSTEIDVKASSDSMDKARLEITQLQGEVKNRDEKITTLTERLADHDKQLIELKYQMKDLKKSLYKGTTIGSSKKANCDDGSCSMDTGIQDIDDL